MEKLNFTSNELINSLSFTEDDFNKAAECKRISISFKEFIQDIMGYCQKYGCALDDAIFLAEDDFKEFSKKTYNVCFDSDTSSNNEGSIYCNETEKTVYAEKVK